MLLDGSMAGVESVCKESGQIKLVGDAVSGEAVRCSSLLNRNGVCSTELAGGQKVWTGIMAFAVSLYHWLHIGAAVCASWWEYAEAPLCSSWK